MIPHTYAGRCELDHTICPHGNTNGLSYVKRRDCPLCAPCPACDAPRERRARLDAYYYSFEPTGVTLIDELLSAVAWAGTMYHDTVDWNYLDPSETERIQAAAAAGAEAVKTMEQTIEDWRPVVDAAKTFLAAATDGAGMFTAAREANLVLGATRKLTEDR